MTGTNLIICWGIVLAILAYFLVKKYRTDRLMDMKNDELDRLYKRSNPEDSAKIESLRAEIYRMSNKLHCRPRD